MFPWQCMTPFLVELSGRRVASLDINWARAVITVMKIDRITLPVKCNTANITNYSVYIFVHLCAYTVTCVHECRRPEVDKSDKSWILPWFLDLHLDFLRIHTVQYSASLTARTQLLRTKITTYNKAVVQRKSIVMNWSFYKRNPEIMVSLARKSLKQWLLISDYCQRYTEAKNNRFFVPACSIVDSSKVSV